MHLSTPNHFRVAGAPAGICIEASAAASGRFGQADHSGASGRHTGPRCRIAHPLHCDRQYDVACSPAGSARGRASNRRWIDHSVSPDFGMVR